MISKMVRRARLTPTDHLVDRWLPAALIGVFAGGVLVGWGSHQGTGLWVMFSVLAAVVIGVSAIIGGVAAEELRVRLRCGSEMLTALADALDPEVNESDRRS